MVLLSEGPVLIHYSESIQDKNGQGSESPVIFGAAAKQFKEHLSETIRSTRKHYANRLSDDSIRFDEVPQEPYLKGLNTCQLMMKALGHFGLERDAERTGHSFDVTLEKARSSRKRRIMSGELDGQDLAPVYP